MNFAPAKQTARNDGEDLKNKQPLNTLRAKQFSEQIVKTKRPTSTAAQRASKAYIYDGTFIFYSMQQIKWTEKLCCYWSVILKHGPHDCVRRSRTPVRRYSTLYSSIFNLICKCIPACIYARGMKGRNRFWRTYDFLPSREPARILVFPLAGHRDYEQSVLRYLPFKIV